MNTTIWVIVLTSIFLIAGFLVFIFGLCASAAKGDADILRAFIEMQKAENERWKYDLTETTTSGCPVDKE
jgi:hypothetical protein